MTQSPEFPELPFVPPRSFNFGRVAGQPTVVVIHSTEGSEGPRSAEDGAAYDQRRTDGTSTHFFVDSNSVVQCVKTTDRANHARATGNKIGIGFELCGLAGQTSTQWHDANSLPMLHLAAKYVAKCCKKYGIPVRRLTVAQLRAGAKGICGHVDITNAFGESTHTDPGTGFPWSEFLGMVSAELNPPEDDMFSERDAARLDNVERYLNALFRGQDAAGLDNGTDKPVTVANTVAQRLTTILAAATSGADEAAIVAGVLAGLDPAAIAAAIPPELASQVADELAARLQD